MTEEKDKSEQNQVGPHKEPSKVNVKEATSVITFMGGIVFLLGLIMAAIGIWVSAQYWKETFMELENGNPLQITVSESKWWNLYPKRTTRTTVRIQYDGKKWIPQQVEEKVVNLETNGNIRIDLN